MSARTITAAGILFAAIGMAAGVWAQRQDEVPALQRGAIAAKDGVVPAELPGVPNASKTTDGKVYFGGQPSAESIVALKEQGIAVVINLRRPEEMESAGFDEKSAVEAAGMEYVNVPMGAELPTAEALKPLWQALGAAAEQPVFLHCASSNRVGAVWAVYAGTEGGKSAEDAIAEGKKAGMKAASLEEAARTRIRESSSTK